MIKNNKIKCIITSLIIILPMLLGVVCGNVLPPEIAVHFGINGEADAWMSATSSFFILPLVMLAIHWLCLILTDVIEKGKVAQHKKISGMMFWIIPAISLISCGMIFALAAGYAAKLHTVLLIILGLTFIYMGNYLPKTTRNLTMGMKLRWTLSNDENWNATHRFSGKVFVAMGFVCLATIPLPQNAFPFIAIAVCLVCVIIPVIYSYTFYRKQLADGRATKEDYEKGYSELVGDGKKRAAASGVALIILAVVAVVMLTGDIETTIGDTSITVKATYCQTLELRYDEIESVEYRESAVRGTRIMGFGSARLLLGSFRSEELGNYTSYVYTGNSPCIVIKTEGRIIVLSDKSEQRLREIYERISAEIAE